MGWLVGYTLASLVGAIIVVRIFDYLFSGVVNGIAHTVRAGLFMGTWTAITVSSGMRDLNARVRRLRKVNRAVSNRIAPLKKR